MANLIRRTLRRTRAPIFNSFSRMVPQVASARDPASSAEPQASWLACMVADDVRSAIGRAGILDAVFHGNRDPLEAAGVDLFPARNADWHRRAGARPCPQPAAVALQEALVGEILPVVRHTPPSWRALGARPNRDTLGLAPRHQLLAAEARIARAATISHLIGRSGPSPGSSTAPAAPSMKAGGTGRRSFAFLLAVSISFGARGIPRSTRARRSEPA